MLLNQGTGREEMCGSARDRRGDHAGAMEGWWRFSPDTAKLETSCCRQWARRGDVIEEAGARAGTSGATSLPRGAGTRQGTSARHSAAWQSHP